MKAIVIHEFGPPDVLKYEEVADPVPRHGEICIKVRAATVNRVLDVALRAGKQLHRGARLPLTPGVDCTGVVVAVGPGVTRLKVGDCVAAGGFMPLATCEENDADYDGPRGMMGIHRAGSFAETVAVPACIADLLPANIGFHEAAVAYRHAPVAWNLLINLAQVKAGECVLVMGAGGNLGSIGIQIAKNVIGARVIAAAGSDDRVAIGLRLGADYGVNYKASDIRTEVMKITGGKGVDVLYDNIANPDVLPDAFRALGNNGRLVTAGSLAGPCASIDFYHLTHCAITIRGMVAHRRANIPQCLHAVAEGKIKMQIAKILPLSQAAVAHHLVEADPGMGKIVLDPTLHPLP